MLPGRGSWSETIAYASELVCLDNGDVVHLASVSHELKESSTTHCFESDLERPRLLQKLTIAYPTPQAR